MICIADGDFGEGYAEYRTIGTVHYSLKTTGIKTLGKNQTDINGAQQGGGEC